MQKLESLLNLALDVAEELGCYVMITNLRRTYDYGGKTVLYIGSDPTLKLIKSNNQITFAAKNKQSDNLIAPATQGSIGPSQPTTAPSQPTGAANTTASLGGTSQTAALPGSPHVPTDVGVHSAQSQPQPGVPGFVNTPAGFGQLPPAGSQ